MICRFRSTIASCFAQGDGRQELARSAVADGRIILESSQLPEKTVAARRDPADPQSSKTERPFVLLDHRADLAVWSTSRNSIN